MGVNLTDFFFSIAALIFVIALICIAGAVARNMGFGFTAPAKKGRGKRLSVIEMKSLDAKRRLVLLRRDDTEHLILLGTDSELLIEAAITPPAEPKDIVEKPDIPFSPTSAQQTKLTLATIGKAVK